MNIDATVKKYNMLPRGGKILCAVSGGADSVCLLTLLHEMAPAGGFSVCCAHFNHRLRGAEADRDEEFVRRLCADREIEFFAGSGDVAAFAAENGMGTEEAARTLRYDFLEKTAKAASCSRIATAHTADDNAETVLLNLIRGSGTRGLSGIPPVRGIIVRPLIGTTRKEVERYLAGRGIAHVEDSTNRSNDYARNRLRHDVLPVLRELNPGAVGNILRASRLLRADDGLLEAMAARFTEENYSDGALPAAALGELPEPVSARVFRQLSEKPLSDAQVASLRALCAPGMSGRHANLPGLYAAREFDRLVFTRRGAGNIQRAELSPGKSLKAGDFLIDCETVENAGEVHSSLNTFFFKCENICGSIIVRPREPGDSIRLLGRGCTKTLKKLFAEAEIPAGLRDGIPVIADGLGPAAVFGFGVSERCAAAPGDRALKITIKREKTP